MIIKDIITSAKFSELAGVAVKNNIEAIVAFMNLGMVELYSRFPIKVEEHVVSLVTGVNTYTMPTNFMYATEAFAEVTVDASSTDDNLVPIGINEEDDLYSVFFNDWNSVQVPGSITGSHISIIYVAKPNPITIVQAEDGTTELELPDTLVSCLLSYLGYKGHLGVKSDSQSENNAHWNRFERSCDKARELGVAFPKDTMSMNERISDRGFV